MMNATEELIVPGTSSDLSKVLDFHERTKHHLGRFARSLGYMDWETQPDPFRRYEGAPVEVLDEVPPGAEPSFDDVSCGNVHEPVSLSRAALSQLLYDSLALSAWKALGSNSWPLRCNPSSGNLHPTEGYLFLGPEAGVGTPGLYHYSPLLHALERRAVFADDLWSQLMHGLPEGSILAGLTSIHWRESWKYGERAYRYCQHDVGHAIAGLTYAAAALGWHLRLLEAIGDDELGCLVGVSGQHGPEREHPDCLLVLAPAEADLLDGIAETWRPKQSVLDAFEAIQLDGRPNTLSTDHHSWPVIDEVAQACTKPAGASHVGPKPHEHPDTMSSLITRPESSRTLFRQRRSAVDMDGRTWLDVASFLRMLSAVVPTSRRPPLAALPWVPAIELLVFVHRVEELEPGLYALVRNPAHDSRLRESMDSDFLWERPEVALRHAEDLQLFLLDRSDTRRMAELISCQQEIASQGAFAVSMVAEFAPRLEEHGAWFYRRLFWEAGAIGQVLYLEAEAAGVRATGIGCFFDDAMHELLGLGDEKIFQTLYHFTVGGPVEDPRLRTIPAYAHLEEIRARSKGPTTGA